MKIIIESETNTEIEPVHENVFPLAEPPLARTTSRKEIIRDSALIPRRHGHKPIPAAALHNPIVKDVSRPRIRSMSNDTSVLFRHLHLARGQSAGHQAHGRLHRSPPPWCRRRRRQRRQRGELRLLVLDPELDRRVQGLNQSVWRERRYLYLELGAKEDHSALGLRRFLQCADYSQPDGLAGLHALVGRLCNGLPRVFFERVGGGSEELGLQNGSWAHRSSGVDVGVAHQREPDEGPWREREQRRRSRGFIVILSRRWKREGIRH